MSYVTAFWVGGLICALCQILLEKTKLMPGRVMVILVCSGALLGAFNIYQPFVEFAGAGVNKKQKRERLAELQGEKRTLIFQPKMKE